MAKGGDEGHGAPVAVRREAGQTLAFRPPAADRRHVGLDPGLIDEHQALGVDPTLPGLPAPAAAGYRHPSTLNGEQSSFEAQSLAPEKTPYRLIRTLVDEALEHLSPDFAGLYSKIGHPSIPPEKLLRALLLQAFYSIRSERQLMEQLDYNLLFRWFVGLSVDAPVWDATTFSKNRDRLLDGEVARKFLAVVVEQARRRGLLSDDHFSVDETLIEAWASIKSFRPRDGGDEPPGPGRNSERNFHGEKRSNETHASTTDPDARLYPKGNGQSSRMAFMGPC